MTRNFSMTTAALVAATFGAAASAATVGEVDFDGTTTGLISYTNPSEGGVLGTGDGFEQYNTGDNVPFSLIDASVGSFTNDTFGLVVDDVNAAFDGFFGIVDTDDLLTATWVFDIAGFSDLSLAIDLAAWGDFESSDSLSLTASIDGSTPVDLFVFTIDEDISQDYTMADGDTFTYNDPLLVDGVLTSNVYQTITSSIAGTGSELSISITAEVNASTETIAFDNLLIEGTGGTIIPAPTAAFAGVMGLGLLAGRRRR